MNPTGLVVLFTLCGACVGSFLNVVIWRLPRGENLSRPGSRCPRCAAHIRWYDNVPVLSWLWLLARCRRCRAPISPRYPFVELLTAGLFLVVALHHGVPKNLAPAIVHALVLAALVAVSFIDWDHRLIPDAITKPGIVAGLILSFAIPALHPAPIASALKPHLASFLDSAAGAAAGAGILLAVRWLGTKALGKEAMGLGDVKLLAMVGAFTSPIAVLYSLLVASVAGSVLGGIYVAVRAARFAPLSGGIARSPNPTEGGGGAETPFARARLRPKKDILGMVLPAGGAPAVDARVRIRVVLPADAIWEDADATVRLAGVVRSVESRGDEAVACVLLDEPAPDDVDRLLAFAASRLHVPFGPFLAIGGAAMLLYGDALPAMLMRWAQLVMPGPG